MAVLVSVSATRNPLFLILILLCIVSIYLNLDRHANHPRVPVSPLRFTLIVIIVTTLFNTLTSHFGETILFTIPGNIPLLSGILTMEAMVYGATNGLVLGGFFAGFLVLNRALPIRTLLRLVPRAFYPLAVVISVAVTYIPVTQRQFTQIREAQAIRGYRLTGLRGWLPLLMPLLVGGLEHALTLSEAMTARGFASVHQESSSNYQRAFILSGTLLLLAGWIISLVNNDLNMFTLIVASAGAGLLIYGLWSTGKRTAHTVYQQEAWKREDWLVLLGALLVLGAYLLLGNTTSGLDYSPYPKLSIPPFDPLIGIMTLGLLAPLLMNNHIPQESH
jgi:energy-coupling factor transport system permease protein